MPIAVAPPGISEGNRFIAQTAGGAGGGSNYDPLNRIVKIVETRNGTVASTRQFIWAGDQLCEERDASGNVTRRFYNQGEQIAGTNYFYTRDHLGSVRELTDGSGIVQAAYNYDPFGRATKTQGSLDSDMQYAGMYAHQPSGLNLAVNRQYNSGLARWMSRDPIYEPTFRVAGRQPEHANPSAMVASKRAWHLPGVKSTLAKMVMPVGKLQAKNGLNLFAYVNNNPINFRDSSGLFIGGSRPAPNPGPGKSCPAKPNEGCHPPHYNPGWDVFDCYEWCAKHCSSLADYDDCTVECDEWY